MPHGRWTLWHPNGEKAGEGAWDDGRRHGLWILWDEQGDFIGRGQFRDDVPVGSLEFDHREAGINPADQFHFSFGVPGEDGPSLSLDG